MEKNIYMLLFEKFLKREATNEEIQILIEWLKAGNSSDEWLNDSWNGSDMNMDVKLQKAIYAKIRTEIATDEPNITKRVFHSKPSLFNRMAKWAAIFLMPLVSGVSVYFFMQPKPVEKGNLEILVEKGQKAAAVLPDGSKVWVNSDSKLCYGGHFNEKDRVLELNGEAYFEVKPDKTRPFIVKTKNFSVKALGTAFNVKSYDGDIQQSALLVKGKVEVSTPNASTILNPKERLLMDVGSKSIKKEVVGDVSTYTCWRENEISFDAETFDNIAATLERRYNVHIDFASNSLKKYRFTGTVGNTNLQSMLQILSLTSPLVYEVRGTSILLKENLKEKAYFEKAIK